MRAPDPSRLADLSPAESMSAEHRANPLAQYFLRNRGRLLWKWHHYFEIYHRHLERFRGRSPVLLEVGVYHGGSLQMWHEYFGKGTRIVAIDIDPRCKRFEDGATTVLVGDQRDPAFLAGVRRQFPHIDILIDDGGHHMEEQIVTFGELYPHLQPNGVYLCEDVHTSYMSRWEGGLRRPGTFIEFCKALIDGLHAWYHLPKDAEMDAFSVGTHSIAFYDSVVVIEKRPIGKPLVSMTGKPSF
jgi:hypothetical protein